MFSIILLKVEKFIKAFEIHELFLKHKKGRPNDAQQSYVDYLLKKWEYALHKSNCQSKSELKAKEHVRKLEKYSFFIERAIDERSKVYFGNYGKLLGKSVNSQDIVESYKEHDKLDPKWREREARFYKTLGMYSDDRMKDVYLIVYFDSVKNQFYDQWVFPKAIPEIAKQTRSSHSQQFVHNLKS